MKREIKFQRVYEGFESLNKGKIEMREWGPVDEDASFKSPSWLSGFKFIADRQYTGLKDKNGKEIYEGDVLFDISINATCQVVFGCFPTLKDDWGIREISPKFCVLWRDESGYSSLITKEFEVIGNIYENPNLIK
jgi:hypothetical protein